jgi:hypothetical protein
VADLNTFGKLLYFFQNAVNMEFPQKIILALLLSLKISFRILNFSIHTEPLIYQVSSKLTFSPVFLSSDIHLEPIRVALWYVHHIHPLSPFPNPLPLVAHYFDQEWLEGPDTGVRFYFSKSWAQALTWENSYETWEFSYLLSWTTEILWNEIYSTLSKRIKRTFKK